MAPTAKTSPTEPPTSAPANRGGKLLLIILLIAVFILILAVVGVAALLVMKKGAGGNASASNESVPTAPALATSAVDLSKPPIFVQLEPFTVNLRAREGEDNRYLQADIALRVSDQKTADALKGWIPEIRNRINRILTSKSISDIQNDLSHEKVQNEILRGLNTMFGAPPPPPEVQLVQAPQGPIQGVLFISFIVQ